MRRYIRNYVPGGMFFLTAVTYQRRHFLIEDLSRTLLSGALRAVRQKWPFEIIAIVLLPDHFHVIWSLPEGDADFSRRMQKTKELFTKQYLMAGGVSALTTPSEAEHDHRGVWQPRFWEHTIRDEADLKRCADYVHWNPVKHGLVRRVAEYPWSSYHRYVRMGEYAGDWGIKDPCPGYETPE